MAVEGPDRESGPGSMRGQHRARGGGRDKDRSPANGRFQRALADGSWRRGASNPVVVPTVVELAPRFLEWSEGHNKPSTVYAMRYVLKKHLIPALGSVRLDRLTLADIESYKARKHRAPPRPAPPGPGVRSELPHRSDDVGDVRARGLELGAERIVEGERGIAARQDPKGPHR
jgi:hypothetical protein